MSRIEPLGLSVILLSGITTSTRASLLTVEDSNFAIVISRSIIVGHSFNDVMNPFNDSHSVSLGDSTAQAAYDFVWNELVGTASFNTTASHAAEGIDGVDTLVLSSSSSGSIFIRPSVDLVLEIDAEYSYALPVDPMFARLGVAVFNVDKLFELFGDSESYDTIFGAPATGTFEIHGQVVLPADQTWALLYSMTIDTFAGSTGSVGTGEGSVHFDLHPVPEPATLFLLPWVPLAVARRRRTNR